VAPKPGTPEYAKAMERKTGYLELLKANPAAGPHDTYSYYRKTYTIPKVGDIVHLGKGAEMLSNAMVIEVNLDLGGKLDYYKLLLFGGSRHAALSSLKRRSDYHIVDYPQIIKIHPKDRSKDWHIDILNLLPYEEIERKASPEKKRASSPQKKPSPEKKRAASPEKKKLSPEKKMVASPEKKLSPVKQPGSPRLEISKGGNTPNLGTTVINLVYDQDKHDMNYIAFTAEDLSITEKQVSEIKQLLTEFYPKTYLAFYLGDDRHVTTDNKYKRALSLYKEAYLAELKVETIHTLSNGVLAFYSEDKNPISIAMHLFYILEKGLGLSGFDDIIYSGTISDKATKMQYYSVNIGSV
jgi:hypothetical protein